MHKDTYLIRKLNEGNEEAFSELYEKYVGIVYNYIYAVLNDSDQAKDITQFCFVQLWEHRSSIDPEGNLPAYLYVAARNAVYKEARRQVVTTRYIDFSLRVSDGYETLSTERIDMGVINGEIEKVVSGLPESRRKIFLMRSQYGMTVKEISEKLGISPKTVENQIARAISAIRKRLSLIVGISVLVGITFRF